MNYAFDLTIFILIIFGFVCSLIIGIVGVFFISYGNDKYISILDNIFSKKSNLPMIWAWKGNRFRCYCFKYPFFCIFNKTEKLSLKMHLFMFVNSYAIWFWIIAAFWVFCFKQPFEE